jgi:hypothetical protein
MRNGQPNVPHSKEQCTQSWDPREANFTLRAAVDFSDYFRLVDWDVENLRDCQQLKNPRYRCSVRRPATLRRPAGGGGPTLSSAPNLQSRDSPGTTDRSCWIQWIWIYQLPFRQPEMRCSDNSHRRPAPSEPWLWLLSASELLR